MLAFSFWNAIWLVIVCFFFISVLMMLFSVIIDLVHDHDVGGWGKAAWMIGLVLFPLLGLLVYLIVRGGGMAERSAKHAAQQQQVFDAYVRDVSGGSASELERAADLHNNGKLSDAEFAATKAKILA